MPPACAKRAGRPFEAALARVDAMVARAARQFPEALPAFHPARLRDFAALDRTEENPDIAAWSDLGGPARRCAPGGQSGNLPESSLSPRRGRGFPAALAAGATEPGADADAARLFSAGRDHALALLAAEDLGDALLSADERERLIIRAAGVAPADCADLFAELAPGPALAPGTLAGDPAGLVSAVRAIGRHYRPGPALAWGMLALANCRAPEQLRAAAGKLDRAAGLVTSASAVAQAFERAAAAFDARRAVGVRRPSTGLSARFAQAGGQDPCLETGLGLLTAVRDRLWELKPDRVSTPFLLPQVLDCFLGPEAGVGNSLGLALLDALVLDRLGFECGFLADGGTTRLEVGLEDRKVHWQTTRPGPLGFIAPAGARRLSLEELFGLAWSSLAAAHFLNGRVEPAIANYERVLAVLPGSADAHLNIGNCWLRRRMPDKAAASFERAAELRHDFAEALCGLGNAFSMLERWPCAIAAYRRAVAARPDYVEAWNNLGFAYQHHGDPGQAVAAYRRAVEARPDYVQAHFNLGNVALELERWEDAVGHYREAARLQPSLAQAWYNMGQALYRAGELDGAIAAYRRAVEANPKHFGAWHNLGIAWRDKGETDKAVEAIERAVAINPNLMR
ncbi:MAG: tetratricopeptide repeat protein [bacterium]